MSKKLDVDAYRAVLRAKPEFNALTEATFEQLTRDLQIKSYPKGQVLFDQGDPRNRFYFVIKGVVRLEKIDETGDFGYLDYVKPDKGFPYRGLFTATEYPYSATAMTAVVIASFEMADYESVIRNRPENMVQLITIMGRIIDHTEDRLQRMVTSSARNRVKQALIIFGEELGVPSVADMVTIPYPITLIELARVSGTTRETTGQIISQLVASGLVTYQHKTFTFDPKTLI